MATRIQAAVMETKSGMTTQVRGLPCLSKSGHGKPRLSYNGHMPKPLSLHFGKSFPLRMVSFIACLVSFFFFVAFVSGLFAFSVPWLIFASVFLAWSFHFFLSFVPVSFEITQSALITHFSTGKATVRPWNEVKIAKVAGPLYAAGGKRWMVLGWFLVRDSRQFEAET